MLSGWSSALGRLLFRSHSPYLRYLLPSGEQRGLHLSYLKQVGYRIAGMSDPNTSKPKEAAADDAVTTTQPVTHVMKPEDDDKKKMEQDTETHVMKPEDDDKKMKQDTETHVMKPPEDDDKKMKQDTETHVMKPPEDDDKKMKQDTETHVMKPPEDDDKKMEQDTETHVMKPPEDDDKRMEQDTETNTSCSQDAMSTGSATGNEEDEEKDDNGDRGEDGGAITPRMTTNKPENEEQTSTVTPSSTDDNIKISAAKKPKQKLSQQSPSSSTSLVSRFKPSFTRSKSTPVARNYSEMPREERRKYYSCGNNYYTLSQIQPWSESYKSHSPKESVRPFYTVDSDLNAKISLWRGDITRLEIDAIVNAANSSLLGGGGVDGAIHRAAGGGLLSECRKLGGCDTGSTKLTKGHRLPANYVLHTVGPMDSDPDKLTSCYSTSLEVALEHDIQSIAFPCIATGIYGYPNEEAAEIALSTTRKWLEKHRNEVTRIIFCVFLDVDWKHYIRLLHAIYPVASDENSSYQEPTKPPVEESNSSVTVTVPSLKTIASAPAGGLAVGTNISGNNTPACTKDAGEPTHEETMNTSQESLDTISDLPPDPGFN